MMQKTGSNRLHHFKCAASIVLMLVAGSATAAIESLTFDSAEQESRYKNLISELRCLVCQNQTLADSNADLAIDLRNITYEMVTAGRSDAEIKAFMVDRYGDFVLYKPPLNSGTLVLWVGPFLLLGIILVSGILIIRRRYRSASPDPVDPAQLERVQKILNSEPTE